MSSLPFAVILYSEHEDWADDPTSRPAMFHDEGNTRIMVRRCVVRDGYVITYNGGTHTLAVKGFIPTIEDAAKAATKLALAVRVPK
jgi:hypothetical protein